MIRAVYHLIRRACQDLEHRSLFRRFQSFTMVPKALFTANLELARRVQNVAGSVVECGVWRGGMIAAVASVLGPERHYYLFDSFQGLPPAKEIDGPSALHWQAAKDDPAYHENCAAPSSYATQAMKRAGTTSFTLAEGWFDSTLPNFEPEKPIAFLRLDGDWYDSTMTCLTSLYDHLSPGAMVIIDDYLTWDGCARAVHDFLSHRSATERLREHLGVTYFIKN